MFEKTMVRSLLVATTLIPGILSKEAASAILSVNSDGTHVQSAPLTSGVEYVLEAFGTCFHYLPYSNQSDAEWANSPLPNETDWKETHNVWISNQAVSWLGTTDGTSFTPNTFSPSHEYRLYVPGTGKPLDFFFSDSYYRDNAGYINVEITPQNPVPEPSTLTMFLGLGGCGIFGWWRKRRTA